MPREETQEHEACGGAMIALLNYLQPSLSIN